MPHLWNYAHDKVGFNFRMPNLNAALGCAQIQKIEQFVMLKRKLTSIYQAAFSENKDISLHLEQPNSRSNYWLQTLVLGDDVFNERESILYLTNSNGKMTRPAWDLISSLEHLRNTPPLVFCSQNWTKVLNIPWRRAFMNKVLLVMAAVLCFLHDLIEQTKDYRL